MELYNRNIFIVSFLVFALFSFNVELPTYDLQIWGNNLSKEGVSDWLFYSIENNLFLILLGTMGFNCCKNRFIKRVFVAILLDGIIGINRHLIFGFYEPFYMPAICNAIPLSYIIYAYFVYGNTTE